MGAVDALFPNSEQHKRLVDMMNKNMAAFLMHYLKDQEATDEFIKEILKNCIEPGLNHSAHECKWDGSTLTLTTPEDESENNASNELESMPFFVNAVSEILGKAEKEKKKKKYSDPKAMFDLDGQRSVGTIHKKNDGKYIQSVSPEVLDLSGGRAPAANTAVSEPTHDGDSDDDSNTGSSASEQESSEDSSSESEEDDDSASSKSSAGSDADGSDVSG